MFIKLPYEKLARKGYFMNFQVGDQIVHWVYGLGEIIQVDEKRLLEAYFAVLCSSNPRYDDLGAGRRR